MITLIKLQFVTIFLFLWSYKFLNEAGSSLDETRKGQVSKITACCKFSIFIQFERKFRNVVNQVFVVIWQLFTIFYQYISVLKLEKVITKLWSLNNVSFLSLSHWWIICQKIIIFPVDKKMVKRFPLIFHFQDRKMIQIFTFLGRNFFWGTKYQNLH